MTRLPELERQLFQAARALDRKPRRWRRFSLLGGGAALALAATTAGAAQLLLPEGDPVPKAPPAQRAGLPKMDPGTSRLSSVRARDPDGGLSWGLAITRSLDGKMFCAQIGRVQGGRLGVIGRDGTFGDDGRFHPLAINATQGGACGGIAPDGDLQLSTDGPPIPASGFTGSFLSSAGGCRERVSDPAATMNPQTRRKLRAVPICKASSLRDVKYGFAGREAVKVEYGGKSVRPDSNESGAYLFVLRPRQGSRSLRITYKDGSHSSPSDVPRGITTSRSPVPPKQERAFAVLRRLPTREDRSPALTEFLRRALGPVGARDVRVDSVRLLRRRSDGVTILVSIGRLGRAPRVITDALCVLSEHKGRVPEITGCGTLEDVLQGRVRATLPPAGLVPDGAKAVRVRVAGGRTIEAPVHDNYYDLARPDGEQYAGIAPPHLIDEHGREFRPTIDQFAG